MVLPLIVDDSTRVAALRTGAVDFNMKVDAKYKTSLLQTSPELVGWQQYNLECVFISFNTQTELFDDIIVRRALHMGMDRQAIGDAVYMENIPMGYPISSVFPETLYTPIEKLPPELKELFEYNPEKARQLLTEAGYPDGFSTSVLTGGGSLALDMLSMIKAYWVDIGVELELDVREGAAVSAAMRAGDYELLIGATAINPLLHEFGHYTTRDSHLNWAFVDDPWFESQIIEGTRMFPGPDKDAFTKGLALYWIGQCWYANFPAPVYYVYHWPWVKGYYGETEGGDFETGNIFARMWLDQDLKEDMGY
ncbi:hypothetical protein ES708_34672 [subsurface metagenome]